MPVRTNVCSTSVGASVLLKATTDMSQTGNEVRAHQCCAPGRTPASAPCIVARSEVFLCGTSRLARASFAVSDPALPQKYAKQVATPAKVRPSLSSLFVRLRRNFRPNFRPNLLRFVRRDFYDHRRFSWRHFRYWPRRCNFRDRSGRCHFGNGPDLVGRNLPGRSRVLLRE